MERRILITGGTGSLGKALIRRLLGREDPPERVVVFSRDELKQWDLTNEFPLRRYKCFRTFLGDVRDRDRLLKATESIECVIHAAALKQVPAAEYNPTEFIKTNIGGAENVINACMENGIKKVIALSTDKACSPVNLYGATKLCSDKLFVAANNIRGKRDIRLSVVRYGNVLGSRGSVVPLFIRLAKSGVIPVTDRRMTRFNITLEEAVDLILWSIQNCRGKEIFVPKIPSYRITDVAEAIGPSCRIEEIGIRPGEKLHEEMISRSDGRMTAELNNCFAILPTEEDLESYVESVDDARTVSSDFSYDSENNTRFLSKLEIRDMIIKHVDEGFKPFV